MIEVYASALEEPDTTLRHSVLHEELTHFLTSLDGKGAVVFLRARLAVGSGEDSYHVSVAHGVTGQVPEVDELSFAGKFGAVNPEIENDGRNGAVFAVKIGIVTGSHAVRMKAGIKSVKAVIVVMPRKRQDCLVLFREDGSFLCRLFPLPGVAADIIGEAYGRVEHLVGKGSVSTDAVEESLGKGYTALQLEIQPVGDAVADDDSGGEGKGVVFKALVAHLTEADKGDNIPPRHYSKVRAHIVGDVPENVSMEVVIVTVEITGILELVAAESGTEPDKRGQPFAGTYTVVYLAATEEIITAGRRTNK